MMFLDLSNDYYWEDKFMMQLMVNNKRKISKIVFDNRTNKSDNLESDRLSKFKDINELKEDAIFLKEIEDAYELHDKGKVKRMNADAFLRELRRW